MSGRMRCNCNTIFDVEATENSLCISSILDLNKVIIEIQSGSMNPMQLGARFGNEYYVSRCPSCLRLWFYNRKEKPFKRYLYRLEEEQEVNLEFPKLSSLLEDEATNMAIIVEEEILEQMCEKLRNGQLTPQSMIGLCENRGFLASSLPLSKEFIVYDDKDVQPKQILYSLEETWEK